MGKRLLLTVPTAQLWRTDHLNSEREWTVRISLDGRKPEGEWASLSEPMGKGDGKRTEFETPFPAKDARGLHIMRNLQIVPPNNITRFLNPDGSLLRDDEDGYTTSSTSPDAPLKVTFQKPVPLNVRVSCSVLGRKPEKGEALKILPLTDAVQVKLDEKMPPEMKRRRREETASLPAMQTFFRDAYDRLVVDAHGFVDDADVPLDFSSQAVKAAIINKLGAGYVGGFAWERAAVLQQERQSGQSAELSD